MTTDAKPGAGTTDAGWDTYWQGTADAQAFTAGGASHPAIGTFWKEIFSELAATGGALPMLDVATGNGAVIASALQAFPDSGDQLHCVDLSPAAIDNIKRRFPGVNGLVCDAGDIPLAAESFRLITSQFGVEYAGEKAFGQVGRLLAPGGQIVLMLHMRGGAIAWECTASLQALEALTQSRFIPLATAMFARGFDALKGGGRKPYEQAAESLAPALVKVESILADYGSGVAGDSILRLYNDVGRIHQRMTHHDPDEVCAWLARMEAEMEAYARRMRSMIECALDVEGFERACKTLVGTGCELVQVGPLQVPGLRAPLAWIIRANRPDAD